MAEIGVDLGLAMDLLQRDELVAIPTETVYGLAGHALHDKAVARIFEVKNRPSFDPLIVHTSHQDRFPDFVSSVPEKAQQLADAFMPGPLTLLLPRRSCIPDLVTAGSDLVAIRIPNHPLVLELLSRLDFPVAAPSANPFGYISPTTAQHVDQQLGDRIAYILDGGPCQIGLESTIIGFPQGQPTIYRKGGLPIESVEALIGPVEVRPFSSSNPQAPGMLQSHYAPRTPLVLGDLAELRDQYQGKNMGLLVFQHLRPDVDPDRQVVLSPGGDLSEAARNLFAALRWLDQRGLQIILAEPAPETGLGRAINDRLRRASKL